MKIITISREFGSGGRELGKRLAESLGYAYYDEEILTATAEHSGLAEEYVKSVIENGAIRYYPITYGRSFSFTKAQNEDHLRIVSSKEEIIRDLATKRDCVIVGRCADVILHDLSPINLFVYADMESKILRCCLKAEKEEHLSDVELVRNIKYVEKKRKDYYEMFSDKSWGNKENYHLCINTSRKKIKRLIPAIANYVISWFENEKEESMI